MNKGEMDEVNQNICAGWLFFFIHLKNNKMTKIQMFNRNQQIVKCYNFKIMVLSSLRPLLFSH